MLVGQIIDNTRFHQIFIRIRFVLVTRSNLSQINKFTFEGACAKFGLRCFFLIFVIGGLTKVPQVVSQNNIQELIQGVTQVSHQILSVVRVAQVYLRDSSSVSPNTQCKWGTSSMLTHEHNYDCKLKIQQNKHKGNEHTMSTWFSL